MYSCLILHMQHEKRLNKKQSNRQNDISCMNILNLSTLHIMLKLLACCERTRKGFALYNTGMVKSSAFFKIKAQMSCNNRKVFMRDDFERTSYFEKDIPYSITVDSACVYLQYIHTVGYPFNINTQLKLKRKYSIRMFSFSFNNKSLLENHHMCRM